MTKRDKLLSRLARQDPNLTLEELALIVGPHASAHRVTGSHFIWQLSDGSLVIPRSKSGRVKRVYIKAVAARMAQLEAKGANS